MTLLEDGVAYGRDLRVAFCYQERQMVDVYARLHEITEDVNYNMLPVIIVFLGYLYNPNVPSTAQELLRS